MSTTFFQKARTYEDFDDWLTQLPAEDVAYLSNITDQVNDDELKDQDTFDQIVAMLIHFSGKQSVNEKEMDSLFQLFTINVAMEGNVREGKMEKVGRYSITDGTKASFKITKKGIQSVKDMLGGDNATT